MSTIGSWRFWVILALALGTLACAGKRERREEARQERLERREQARADRTDRQIFSTLVHEMCHLWQSAHGKDYKKGAHNKEWARKMEAIGLIPSATGEPGGKQTGRNVTHYIEIGGPFDVACDELLLYVHFQYESQPPICVPCGHQIIIFALRDIG
jgi:predicted SprT family Zn-dependent metalloprotease